MTTASFVFTPLKNSFKVLVENLESLSVAQIQEIEGFVAKREGVFDFETYTFVIQKRVSLREFQKLLRESHIEALCRESQSQGVQKPRVSFGRFKGVFYSELPDSYLSWLKNNYFGREKHFIDAECAKRAL